MVSGQGRKSIPLSVRLALVGIVVALCSADVPTQSAAQYGIADLGTLGGSSAAASDVSEYGGGGGGHGPTVDAGELGVCARGVGAHGCWTLWRGRGTAHVAPAGVVLWLGRSS